MATLQVTNLQNTAATVTNVSLLADGTTTLVLNATGTSRTGGLRYNAGTLEVYTSGGVWASAGGGGGSVTGVTASAPLTSSGGASPNLSLTGSVPVANGGTGATSQAAALTNLLPAQGPNAGKFLTTDGTTTSWGSPAVATTGATGVVQVGTNISVNGSGVISVASSSTGQTGIVQLEDSTTSTSTSLALTANQGKLLQQQITALAVTSNITLGGTFNASTGFVDSVTAAGTTAGLTVGAVLPAAAVGNTDIFVIVDVQGSTGPSGAPPYAVGSWFLSNGTAWQYLAVGFAPGSATTTSQGVVELATDAETQTGTDSTRAVVPSALQSKMSDSTSTTSSTTIASSTAVKSAYDLANAAIPKTSLTAKGALVSATAASAPVALPVGSNGQVLSANSACTSGLEWVAVGGTGTVTSVDVSGGTTGLTTSGGPVTGTGTITLGGTLAVANGGTGATTNAGLQAAALPAQAPADAGKFLSTNGSTASWVAAGGAGTVTNVTGTLPISVATGTTTPAISISAATTGAQGAVQVGTNIQVAAGTISVLDSSDTQKGVIEIATQTEATTGTSATLASTPATAVAKTTADQTGFIVTPSSAAAPTTTGYLHYNTTSNHIEYFAAATAKTVVEREGDNMTGKLSVTPSAIAAGAGGWNLATSNYWTVGAIAFPTPTGLSAGQGGLIKMSAAPTSWPAAGSTLKYTGGAAPSVTSFPAILPYYSDGTSVYLGNATQGIT